MNVDSITILGRAVIFFRDESSGKKIRLRILGRWEHEPDTLATTMYLIEGVHRGKLKQAVNAWMIANGRRLDVALTRIRAAEERRRKRILEKCHAKPTGPEAQPDERGGVPSGQTQSIRVPCDGPGLPQAARE